MPLDIMSLITNLQADPKTTLGKHRFKMSGNLSKQGITFASFSEMGMRPTIEVGGSAAQNAYPVPVWYVPMIKTSQSIKLSAIPHLEVTDTTPKFIMTGALSGCTVVANSTGDKSMMISHIQPGGARGSGSNMEFMIEAQGTIGGAQAEMVYGPTSYEDCQANVIGIARKGKWELWAQAFKGGSDNIKEVRQLM